MWFSNFAVVALLCSEALAAPTQSLKKRTFSVQKRAPAISNGRAEILKAYKKFGFDTTGFDLDLSKVLPSLLPGVQSKANSAGSSSGNSGGAKDTGTVDADPEQNDTEFLSPVTIGGQSFVMNFDTGSADLWVFSTELPASERQGHSAFDPSNSTTFKPMNGASWKIQYGDGSGASGTVGTDVVNIGGAEVKGQAVELANKVSSSFVADQNSDGLVGLAFGTINTVKPQQQKTFFESIIDDLEQPVFTAALRHSGTGTYNFGFIDKAQYTGNLEYVPVDSSNGFWEVTTGAFSAGSAQLTRNGGSAIADTGTTLLLLSDDITSNYYAQIPGAAQDPQSGTWDFDCSATIPSLKLTVGTHNVEIAPNLLVFAPSTATRCLGSIQPNRGGDLMILGAVFFKSQFVVFDGKQPALGLAVNAINTN